jgi:hypothetical protein
MEAEISQEDEKESSPSDSDWENRKLCSDGNCIGVIGADGRCNECGKTFEGSPPAESSIEEEGLSPEEEPREAAEPDVIDESPADDDWADRKLCSDGNCIGVIGTDGRCRECGKPYEE